MAQTTPAIVKIIFNYNKAFMIEVDIITNYVLTQYVVYVVHIKTLTFVQYNMKV